MDIETVRLFVALHRFLIQESLKMSAAESRRGFLLAAEFVVEFMEVEIMKDVAK